MANSTGNHRRTEKDRKARVMDHQTQVATLLLLGMGFWSIMLWWTFRNL